MKEKSNSKSRRALAAEFYALALDHEKKHDYMKAYDYYRKSLKLHKDAEVTKAYIKLLSIIGPL